MLYFIKNSFPTNEDTFFLSDIIGSVNKLVLPKYICPQLIRKNKKQSL